MNPLDYLKILHRAENMKNNTRHSWTSTGRHESIAEHTYRLMMMAYFLQDEFPQIQMEKVLKMCLFHDIGEAFTGDIPAFDKTDNHEKIEEQAVWNWLCSLPQPYQKELTLLFEEMNALESQEAKLYKALDKMEALVQHLESPISTWIPLEYELNFTYGTKEAEEFPYLKDLRRLLNKYFEEKIADKNKP